MRVNQRERKRDREKKNCQKNAHIWQAKQEKSNCRHLTPGNKKTEENSK